MKDDRQIILQTPYKIKLTACTRKHLNINITDTGKGNHRRWHAPGGQRVQRAIPPDGFGVAALEVKLHVRTPPPASLVPLPFQGRLICQRRKKIKVAHLHKKTPECQHYRYRQGQQPALTSPRRTARYERIPPDGFDMAALEVAFHGKTPPPASLVPLPFQGRLITANLQTPYFIKLPVCTSNTSEKQHCNYRQGQQPALTSPRRTASATSEFRRTVSTWLH